MVTDPSAWITLFGGSITGAVCIWRFCGWACCITTCCCWYRAWFCWGIGCCCWVCCCGCGAGTTSTGCGDGRPGNNQKGTWAVAFCDVSQQQQQETTCTILPCLDWSLYPSGGDGTDASLEDPAFHLIINVQPVRKTMPNTHRLIAQVLVAFANHLKVELRRRSRTCRSIINE